MCPIGPNAVCLPQIYLQLTSVLKQTRPIQSDLAYSQNICYQYWQSGGLLQHCATRDDVSLGIQGTSKE